MCPPSVALTAWEVHRAWYYLYVALYVLSAKKCRRPRGGLVAVENAIRNPVLH